MSVALYMHDDGLNHVTPEGHPEQVARLRHIARALSVPAFDALDRRTMPQCDDADIGLCHPQTYVDRIKDAVPQTGLTRLDEDTWLSPGSMSAARRAVGGAIAAVDAVLDGAVGKAFVATRPPGHHAETAKPMGFCLFGNVAIAARHAMERRGLARVAIVDFDVHHGNGTQDLLWNEDRALFIGSHQSPLWPGSGRAAETGAHDNVMNIELPPHSTGTEMRAAYETRVFPALDAFAPELILVSAGFDAHADDPLAQLNWQTDDYVWLTENLCALAARHCGGKLVSILEGGYNLEALADATAAHVGALMAA